jgi:hypothetical protein
VRYCLQLDISRWFTNAKFVSLRTIPSSESNPALDRCPVCRRRRSNLDSHLRKVHGLLGGRKELEELSRRTGRLLRPVPSSTGKRRQPKQVVQSAGEDESDKDDSFILPAPTDKEPEDAELEEKEPKTNAGRFAVQSVQDSFVPESPEARLKRSDDAAVLMPPAKTIRKDVADCACQTGFYTNEELPLSPSPAAVETTIQDCEQRTAGPRSPHRNAINLSRETQTLTDEVRPAAADQWRSADVVCLGRNMADVQRSMLCIAHQINQMDHACHRVHPHQQLKAKWRPDVAEKKLICFQI